jgi:fumarylacetoacetate (FAA) hydrolase family protein
MRSRYSVGALPMSTPALVADLPADWRSARLAGRLLLAEGPTPVLIERGRVFDMTSVAPTLSELVAMPAIDAAAGTDIGPLDAMALSTDSAARVLAPVDLQVIKASGVTFAVSAVERVIEERAGGDAARAQAIRAGLAARVGADIRAVVPGSPAAATLKAVLIADGLWSQYLEVAIGPDAEIFTKAPVLAAVGWGDQVGVRGDSSWNNPEPEVVVIADPVGRAIGATLGNDVNLRDIEGRSALLLGKAKDNNASCAIGPFIRLFDGDFTMDDVRTMTVRLAVEGTDGYRLSGESSMAQISRDPLDLLAQTAGANHDYPDGFALFLGTMFAPTQDRDGVGQGFTHHAGDLVLVSSDRLGTLRNTVTDCATAPPWRYGIAALMRNLASRGLLA